MTNEDHVVCHLDG